MFNQIVKQAECVRFINDEVKVFGNGYLFPEYRVADLCNPWVKYDDDNEDLYDEDEYYEEEDYE